MGNNDKYMELAQAYSDGLRELFAPPSPPTRERGALRGPSSYEDLAEKAERLLGFSENLGRVVSSQLSAPDPVLRIEGSTRMIAKALADLEVQGLDARTATVSLGQPLGQYG